MLIGTLAALSLAGLAVAGWAMIGPRPSGPIEGLPVWWLEPGAAEPRSAETEAETETETEAEAEAETDAEASRESPAAIVWLTSDSGWLRLNSSMPRTLAAEGHPVVIWNSLRYYLSRKEPARAAADLSAIVAALGERGHDRVYLVGYSYGAGVLPFLVNRLPADDRERVIGVGLLAYPGKGEFRFSPVGWFGRVTSDARPALPEVEQLDVPVLCAAGESDPIRDCRSLAGTGANISFLPTGHRLGPVADEVRRLLEDALAADGG
jgi:type IV secretory pathway VirJ component